jgi:hypothetical protein
MANLLNGRTVELELVGLDGNAFYLMGAWQSKARRAGFSKEDIDKVLKECQSGDYDHLLCTLMDHCKSPDEEDEMEDEGEDDLNDDDDDEGDEE